MNFIRVRVTGFDEHTEESFCNIYGATEVKQNEPYYGNGRYIVICHEGNTEVWNLIDARYESEYDFLSIVTNFFEKYFGKNLRRLEAFVEEEKDINFCVFNSMYNQEE